MKSADCGCDTHETHSKCKDDCDCDPVTEGKAKNPKQQAAIAIAKKKDGYKESLADKLAKEQSEYVYEKQKGVDGKVCWKGYKRMGTKKKGGKTVDNCVKM